MQSGGQTVSPFRNRIAGRMAKGFVPTLLAQMSVLALGVFTGVASARLLGPQGRGELAALILWPSVLVMLASLGMNQAIVFYTGKQRYPMAHVWAACTLIGLAQSVCVVLVGLRVLPWALHAYAPGVRHLALVFLFATPFLMMGGYPGNLLQGSLDLASFNLIRIIAPLAYALGLAVLLLLRRADLASVVSVQILGYVLALAAATGCSSGSWDSSVAAASGRRPKFPPFRTTPFVYHLELPQFRTTPSVSRRTAPPQPRRGAALAGKAPLLIQEGPERERRGWLPAWLRSQAAARTAAPAALPRFPLNLTVLKSLLTYGGKTQLATITSYINQRLDQLVLSIFIRPPELGLYVVAVTVSTVLSCFPQAAAVVTLANGSNLPREGAKAVIANSFRTSLAWLVAGCSALFLVAPWLIPLVFGPRFSGSVLACRILLPGSVAIGLNQILYDGARSLDEPALPSYGEGLAAVLTCCGLYVLLPRLGFLGAAIASTVAYTASSIFMLALYHFRLGFPLRELLFDSGTPRPHEAPFEAACP